jgi:hypothetical protein
MVASAPQCPASSRATATTTIKRGLPRASSVCQRPCSLRGLESAWARTASDLPVRLRSNVTLNRGALRWVPGGFEQKPACVSVAGPGNPAFTAALPA